MSFPWRLPWRWVQSWIRGTDTFCPVEVDVCNFDYRQLSRLLDKTLSEETKSPWVSQEVRWSEGGDIEIYKLSKDVTYTLINIEFIK